MATQPIVLEIESATELVEYVLHRHAPPSTLIVCSSKAAFLQAIQGPEEVPAERQGPVDEVTVNLKKMWQKPTLRFLSTSRTLKLVFCPDITLLRAYLSTYSITVSQRKAETDTALRPNNVQPILAILNPIQLHRETSAFSAQGFNRTFSVAVEAAHHTESKLIFAESPLTPGFEPTLNQDISTEQTQSLDLTDPWDEEVSLLNVTTKRLGELSVGRTVKVRTVAERWCTFATMPEPV